MKIKAAPIQFVSGKGGVGKSLVSAAIAFKLASENKKVLLVELGERSFYEKFFQIPKVHYKPEKLTDHVDICMWDFKLCLKEYVGFYIRSEKLYDIFFGNSIMQKLIEAAPALKELAILGKATSGPRNVGPKVTYDAIVIDSFSTGHHRALMRGPQAIAKVVHRGPMGHHSEKMNEILVDPKWTSHFIVMKPEELPTIEGIELYEGLKKDLGVHPQVIMNMVHKDVVPLEELESYSEKSKVAGFYSEIFKEQQACITKAKKTSKSYCEIPFSFIIEDKLKLIKELSGAL